LKTRIGLAVLGLSAIVTAAIIVMNLDQSSHTVRTLRSAGFLIEGRDPCNGSELCCGLLPANKDDEVYYVTLPDSRWDYAHLVMLKRFNNVQQVRANRSVSADEYQELCRSVIDPSSVLVNVLSSGDVKYSGPTPD
jgi:hypothetical protein